jgi:hypothetical protein
MMSGLSTVGRFRNESGIWTDWLLILTGATGTTSRRSGCRTWGSSTVTQCSSRITPRNEDVSADLALLAVEQAVSDAALTYGNVISIWTVRLEKIRILLAYAKIAHDN